MESAPKPFYHYTIIGAGASGLFLAQALLRSGLLDNRTLCMVESDTTKSNDRTWCYWNKGPLTSDPVVSMVWSEIRNVYQTSSAIHPYQYHHIHSVDFYRHMKSELTQCRNIHWISDTVDQIREHNSLVSVNGLTFRWTTQKVFTSAKIDSISAVSAMSKRIVERKNSLTQSFVGWRVQTHSPVFHPKLMTLMDFNVPQGNHTQFLYLLPFTPNTALIELTRFGDVELTQKEAELELKRQMDKIGCNYSVNEVEIGSIPMTTAFDATHRYYPSGSNIIPIGTIAGAIKPTTGYGFKRMYAHAQAIATALANNQPIPTTKRKFRFQFYDALLLFILKKHPEKGKPIFERLFSSQSVPIILKFLDEETTIHEELLIFAKLPIPLFVRSLCYYIFKR